MIGLESALLTVPVNILIATLFRKAAPTPPKWDVIQRLKSKCKKQKQPSTIDAEKNTKQSDSEQRKNSKTNNSAISFSSLRDLTEQNKSARSNTASNQTVTPNGGLVKDEVAEDRQRPIRVKLWPWWCRLVAWVLIVITVVTSAFFVLLYSVSWGPEKSQAWLLSFLFGFFQDVIIIQPFKVREIKIVDKMYYP